MWYTYSTVWMNVEGKQQTSVNHVSLFGKIFQLFQVKLAQRLLIRSVDRIGFPVTLLSFSFKVPLVLCCNEHHSAFPSHFPFFFLF